MKIDLQLKITEFNCGSCLPRRSDDGSTPTHAAGFSCSATILSAIVKNGGDLRLHDYRDLSVRDWAVEAGAKRNKKVILCYLCLVVLFGYLLLGVFQVVSNDLK